MKRWHFILIITGIALLIGLSALNAYISVKGKQETQNSITQAVATYEAKDIQNTNRIIVDTLEKINVRDGEDGKDGMNGINGRDGKDGETKVITEVKEKPSEKPKDGKDGKNGRTPIFDVDPDTGDILVKYEGDTIWNVLMEGCKLTKDCKE